MSPIALICSLPVAAVGIYYLVNASAAVRLGAVEGQRANRIRVRLRRANGVVMILLGGALYVAVSRTFHLEAGERPGLLAPLAWMATLPLLLAMLVLAWLDIRLTRKLKRDLMKTAARKTDRPGQRANRALLLAALLMPVASLGCEEPAARSTSAPATMQSTPATAPSTPADPGVVDAEPDRDPRAQRLETVAMTLAGKVFHLQLANDPQERQIGFMYRQKLAENEGMIFVFPDADYRSFWMKNTYVPLDILFVSPDGTIQNIAQMAARDLRGTDSAGRAKYVIELPLNTAKRLELRPGMQLDIPEAAREAAE